MDEQSLTKNSLVILQRVETWNEYSGWDREIVNNGHKHYVELGIMCGGNLDWGPIKYRQNEKREFQGTSRVRVTESHNYYATDEEEHLYDKGKLTEEQLYYPLRRKAEDHAIEIALILEHRGINLELGNKGDEQLWNDLAWRMGRGMYNPQWDLKTMPPEFVLRRGILRPKAIDLYASK